MSDQIDSSTAQPARRYNYWLGDRAEFTDLFAGLDLIDPGVQPVSEWRAQDEPEPRPNPAHIAVYGAVARKP